MTDIHTRTLSLSEQAAREAVALEFEAQGQPTTAAMIRAGERDRAYPVQLALAGARAAHSATLEAVVRACAEVAGAESKRLTILAGALHDADHDQASIQRELQAVAADEIEHAILALLEKDTTT